MESFPLKRTLVALLLFGSAFGYLEAAVVAYLRQLHEPARQRVHPGRSSAELFPLLTLEELRASGLNQQSTLAIEIGREAATIVMLAAVALAVSRNAGQWAAAMAIAFGTWDITFYVFLKLLLDWPASLLTWDILFLIPLPWVGPVLAPAAVSLLLVAAFLVHVRLRRRNRVLAPRGPEWGVAIAGALLVIVAFCWRYRAALSEPDPAGFPWWLFAAGVLIGAAPFVRATGRALRERGEDTR